MAVINMTRDAAEVLLDAVRRILDANPGLPLMEIELRAGDKSGRDGAPADEVEIHARYEAITIIGGNGNG